MSRLQSDLASLVFFVVFASESSAGTRQKLFAILPTILLTALGAACQTIETAIGRKEFEHRRTATTYGMNLTIFDMGN